MEDQFDEAGDEVAVGGHGIVRAQRLAFDLQAQGFQGVEAEQLASCRQLLSAWAGLLADRTSKRRILPLGTFTRV